MFDCLGGSAQLCLGTQNALLAVERSDVSVTMNKYGMYVYPFISIPLGEVLQDTWVGTAAEFSPLFSRDAFSPI